VGVRAPPEALWVVDHLEREGELWTGRHPVWAEDSGGHGLARQVWPAFGKRPNQARGGSARPARTPGSPSLTSSGCTRPW